MFFHSRFTLSHPFFSPCILNETPTLRTKLHFQMKGCTLIRTSLSIWVSMTLVHQWDLCSLGHTWRAMALLCVMWQAWLSKCHRDHSRVRTQTWKDGKRLREMKCGLRRGRGAEKGRQGSCRMEGKIQERWKTRQGDYNVRKVDMKGMCIGRNSC